MAKKIMTKSTTNKIEDQRIKLLINSKYPDLTYEDVVLAIINRLVGVIDDFSIED